MKKILFISTLRNVDWGGSEALWSQVAADLAHRGFTIAFVTAPKAKTIASLTNLVALGLKWYVEPKDRFVVRYLKQKIQWQKYAEQVIDNFKPDHVVVSLSSYWMGEEWTQACRKQNVTYSLIYQIVNDQIRFSSLEALKNFRQHVQGASTNYFVSQQNHQLLERLLAIPIANGNIVWNPYKGSLETGFQYPEVTDTYALASVASLTPNHKGQEVLFEVLGQKKWKETNLVVNLFGTGPFEMYLQDLLRYYDLKNVFLKGHGAIEKIWQDNHAHILPSKKEGMSLALIESMVMGRLAITTDVGGAREIITDNENGFIAKAATAELVDEAMERAWQRRLEWKSISEKAYYSIRQQIEKDPAAALADKIIASIG